MSKMDFPGAFVHDQCWSAFIQRTNWRTPGALDKWMWFLAGWGAGQYEI